MCNTRVRILFAALKNVTRWRRAKDECVSRKLKSACVTTQNRYRRLNSGQTCLQQPQVDSTLQAPGFKLSTPTKTNVRACKPHGAFIIAKMFGSRTNTLETLAPEDGPDGAMLHNVNLAAVSTLHASDMNPGTFGPEAVAKHAEFWRTVEGDLNYTAGEEMGNVELNQVRLDKYLYDMQTI